MATKKLKVGDEVLFLGQRLTITEFDVATRSDGTEVERAVVMDTDMAATRKGAMDEFNATREREAAFTEAVGCRQLADNPENSEEERARLTARAEELEGADDYPAPSEVAALRERLLELDKAARSTIFRLRIRTDLLSWWSEKGAWVSDGRILSDEQRAEVKEEFQVPRVAPGAERKFYAMLEG